MVESCLLAGRLHSMVDHRELLLPSSKATAQGDQAHHAAKATMLLCVQPCFSCNIGDAVSKSAAVATTCGILFITLEAVVFLLWVLSSQENFSNVARRNLAIAISIYGR